ncbi:MAG TPA: YqaA family protein [Rhodocyclaceae bacterium]|jgi:membrane protein YqaA with SNARE-associated domain|nr:YqaA family protein [Rhodocyclaceae bacterium]
MTDPQLGLAGLFLVSFLAATLLPGGSEAAFLAFIATWPAYRMEALCLATLGNTLGGMSSYALAWLLPGKVKEKINARLGKKTLSLARRWGTSTLLLAWTPVIGDFLCLAAGWLRLPWLPSALWMALGKGARYAMLMAGWQLLTT